MSMMFFCCAYQPFINAASLSRISDNSKKETNLVTVKHQKTCCQGDLITR